LFTDRPAGIRINTDVKEAAHQQPQDPHKNSNKKLNQGVGVRG
jgi:hypothetical protein